MRHRIRLAARALALWSPRRWGVAVAGAGATALVIGLPTAVIPSPVFGREIAPEWWSYPALGATALLAGVVLATYVGTGRSDTDADTRSTREPASRLGAAGSVLSFLAIGCPVCNKLVLLALGTSGAVSYWAPLQPILGLASLALLAVAAVQRLAGEVACPASARTGRTSRTGRTDRTDRTTAATTGH
ncbi:hypothetical protein [Streptomyces coryli]|uniref:hypothetical protein n=1 Tax=Streptomyces coryli TaxID=1128680 RepID=UPI001F0D9815|nr:hypothetical protein [Streptomyces coryli]